MYETSTPTTGDGAALYIPSPPPDDRWPDSHIIWSGRKEQTLSPGEFLFKQGAIGGSVYRIYKGLVETRVSLNAANDISIDFRGQGATFGVTTVFGHCTHNFSARAATLVTYREIGGEDFRRYVFNDERLFRASLTDAAISTDRCMALAGQLKLKSATQRLASFLLELVATAEHDEQVRLPMTKVQLASYLGMAPESLSRCLKHLRDLGVGVRGDKVQITDVDILQRFIDKD